MSIEELDGQPGVYVRKWQKLLRVLEIPSNTQYRPPRICEVDAEGKIKLLKNWMTYEDEGQRIMKGLTDLSRHEEARQYFGVKKDAVDEFCFRLLQDGLDADCVYTAAEHNFIILSYTWHSNSWTPQPMLMKSQQSHNTQETEGPLLPAMWEAFVSQRNDRYESLWVDQLCISQSSEHEKSVAIGSMDLLYRSARKVVVAIEDVAFTISEVELMLSYTDSDLPRSQWPQHDLNALSAAFQKLVKARWFQRAWCLHEFLVSRTHVFLVPISQDSTERGSPSSYSPSTKILQVDGPFLVLLFEIFIKQDIEHYRMGSASQAPTFSLNGEGITRIRRFFTRLRALQLGEVFGSETVLADGSYMHMFSEIWSHGTMYNEDKLSILLNTMNSGLCLIGSHSLSEAHCWLLTTLVALAAGDVTALATNGNPIFKALATNGDPIPTLGDGKRMRGMQWARRPSYGDQARRIGALTIAQRAIGAKLLYDGLELEVKFIATSDSFVSPAEQYLSNARWLIDHRSLCLISEDRQEMRLDLETDDRMYTDMRLSYIQTLACALQCGRDWMVDCYVQSYLSMPRGVHLLWTQESKQTFGEAIDWALDMDLEGHDIDPDMEKSWQEYLETTAEEDENNKTSTSPFTGEDVEPEATVQGQEYDDEFSPQEHVWYSLLLDFTETIFSFGLTISHDQPGITSSPTESSSSSSKKLVQICNLSSAPHPFLIFAAPPPLPLHSSSTSGKRRRADDVYLCIPTALLDESYDWMFRTWILSPEGMDGNLVRTTETDRYSLLGKTKLFGPRMAAGALDESHSQRITVVR